MKGALRKHRASLKKGQPQPPPLIPVFPKFKTVKVEDYLVHKDMQDKYGKDPGSALKLRSKVTATKSVISANVDRRSSRHHSHSIHAASGLLGHEGQSYTKLERKYTTYRTFAFCSIIFCVCIVIVLTAVTLYLTMQTSDFNETTISGGIISRKTGYTKSDTSIIITITSGSTIEDETTTDSDDETDYYYTVDKGRGSVF